MEHAGTILTSYAVVIGGVAAYAGWLIRRARALAAEVRDEDKTWT